MKLNARQIEEACELDNDVEQDLESDRLDREHLEFYGDDWRAELEPDDGCDINWAYDDHDYEKFRNEMYCDPYDEPFYNDDDRY